MTVSLVQNFFKQTVTTPWTTGTGNFYVSQKPNVTSGFLVISPNSESLREIVAFSAVGTDGGACQLSLVACVELDSLLIAGSCYAQFDSALSFSLAHGRFCAGDAAAWACLGGQGAPCGQFSSRLHHAQSLL